MREISLSLTLLLLVSLPGTGICAAAPEEAKTQKETKQTETKQEAKKEKQIVEKPKNHP